MHTIPKDERGSALIQVIVAFGILAAVSAVIGEIFIANQRAVRSNTDANNFQMLTSLVHSVLSQGPTCTPALTGQTFGNLASLPLGGTEVLTVGAVYAPLNQNIVSISIAPGAFAGGPVNTVYYNGQGNPAPSPGGSGFRSSVSPAILTIQASAAQPAVAPPPWMMGFSANVVRSANFLLAVVKNGFGPTFQGCFGEGAGLSAQVQLCSNMGQAFKPVGGFLRQTGYANLSTLGDCAPPQPVN